MDKKTLNFLTLAKEKHGNKFGYQFLNYIKASKPIEIVCPTHGRQFITASIHLRGEGCPLCAKEAGRLKKIQPPEVYIEKAINVHGDKYDLSRTKYTRKDGKCIIGCPVHGFVKNSIESLRRGAGCNKCNASVGENLIGSYLDKVKIPYEREYPIRNFGDINRYRYDFYLPTLNIVIEFHGKQHYDVVDYFGGESRFKENQERDSYKENFLKIVGIPLLVIKYTQVDEIPTLIANFIHKLFPYEYKGVLYHSMNKLLKAAFIDPHTPVEDIIKQYNSLTYLTSPLTKQLVN